MTDNKTRARRKAIRAEYAVEEAEAARAEALDIEQTVLSVRVPTYLAETLKTRAEAEHISASALVRRILTQASQGLTAPVITIEQVEEIARRIVHQEQAAH